MLRLRLPTLATRVTQNRLFSSSGVKHAQPPVLDHTVRRYLNSIEAVTEPSKFQETVKRVEAFKETLGSTLQERLIKKDAFIKSKVVLGRDLTSRSSLCVKSNWWFQLDDHPNHPKTLISKPPPKDVISSFQIERAAGLILNALNFKDTVQSDPYENLFGAARIPLKSVDSVVKHDSKHIVVITRDQFYKLNVIDNIGNKPTLKELQRLLFAIGANSLETDIQPNVGALTSTNRDEWAENYTKLASASPENQSNLDAIASALFVVCLDDHSTIANINHSHHQFIHNNNGRNRWFDKPLQIILASSGRTGLNVEVSSVDISAYTRFAEYLTNNEPAIDKTTASKETGDKTTTTPQILFPEPTKLTWTLTPELETAISTSLKRVETMAATNAESVLFHSDIYGSRYMQQVARSDPSAFMKLALAVTWRRLHKSTTGTASTSLSTESPNKFVTGFDGTKETWAFAESFDDDDVLYDDKRGQFRAAEENLLLGSGSVTLGENGEVVEVDPRQVDLEMESHISALIAAAESSAEKEELEGIFGGSEWAGVVGRKVGLDTVNIGSSIPSSSSGAGSGSFYAGFSQSWANGYGIAYSIGVDDVKLSISNKKGGKTSSYRFADTLKRTLADMMILFPKRSEVWGYDWKEKFARKRKEEYYLKTMRKLSDDYLAQKDSLAKKYASQMKK
ncbi:hypothetical protein BDR26DRAFT_817463 [Obelidium mucronatum]|nr:hypothetical protein BDR26DRAFT_817463 [Obelidium mucronatum]